MYRVILADDEPPALNRLKRLVEKRSDCEIIAACGNGAEVLEVIGEGGSGQKPDLLLLDIQMPGMSGFDVLASLPVLDPEPAVVFVTAYDKHAIKAFDVAAVDYVLKPWSPKRMNQAIDRAIERAIERLADQGSQPTGASPLASVSAPMIQQLLQQVAQERDIRIVVRDGSSTQFIHVNQIDVILAEGNYVEIHHNGRDVLHRETLSSMEQRLGPLGFFRVNRSTLVNLDRVNEVCSPRGGSRVVRLDQGEYKLTRALAELEAAMSERLR